MILVKATPNTPFAGQLNGNARRMRLVKLDAPSAFTVQGQIHPEGPLADIAADGSGFYDMLGITHVVVTITAGAGVVGNISGESTNDA